MSADRPLSPEDCREIQQLADALLHGDATEQQRRQLDQLVAGNPAAGVYYVRTICDGMHLRDWARSSNEAAAAQSTESTPSVSPAVVRPASQQATTSDSETRDQPQPVPRPTPIKASWSSRLARQLRRRVYLIPTTIVLGIAFWFLIAAVISSAWRGRHSTATDPAVAAAADIIARVIWVDHGTSWEGYVPIPRGRGMRAGQQLKLRTGLAEIHYTTGAIVILEAPAEFTVGANAEQDSAPNSDIRDPKSNSGLLARGKLVARCGTRDSKGFTVEMPHARIQDLGTEFAVEVQDDGAAEVAVLSGEVEFVAQSAGGGTRQRRRLKKGQGASLASGGGAIVRRSKGRVQLSAAMRERLQKLRPALAAGAEPAGRKPAAVAGTAHAAPILSVDFGAPGQHVQSGFEEFTGALAQSARISNTYSGITVTVSGNNGATMDVRNRPQVTHALGDLVEDVWYMGNNNTQLLVTLGGLTANTYSITTYHHDSQYQISDLGDISVDTGSGFSTAVAGPLSPTTGTSPTTVASYTFQFTANGTDDVVIRFNKGLGKAFTNGFSLNAEKTGGD